MMSVAARRLALWLVASMFACGSSDAAKPATTIAPAPTGGSNKADAPAPMADAGPGPIAPADSAAPPSCPSSGTWASLIPGPGQPGYDAALADAIGKHDRMHEALVSRAVGLASSGVSVTDDSNVRQKLAHFVTTTWNPTDGDPTDDLTQYEGLDPFTIVTSWQIATGMYAGAALAADAYRYGVLRDRGGSCNDVARARKMLEVGLDGLHAVVDITGNPGSIARAIARTDLPGDGQSTVTPLFDANQQPLPTEKNNGTSRADNSKGAKYPNLSWVDSCSRDMLFGWTFAMASVWEVIEKDAEFDPQRRARLQADAKNVLDGLRVVRPSGKDLELWDPDGRRTFHGNMHETSIDRDYVIKNGPASVMALGEVAGLVGVVGDASAKGYLDSLVNARGLVDAAKQSMLVVALGGDQSNHSAFNMLFMTAWMAHRYIDDWGTRNALKKPIEQDLYAPFLGARPVEWKQSFFDLVVAASTGDAWRDSAAKAAFDHSAVSRALDTLGGYHSAPFFGDDTENCDASEVAAGTCTLADGVTVVGLKNVKWGLIADQPIPMKLRPTSNYYWRTDPYLVNGTADPNTLVPAADARIAYWIGRWVRVGP
jgi:hypothetical protein